MNIKRLKSVVQPSRHPCGFFHVEAECASTRSHGQSLVRIEQVRLVMRMESGHKMGEIGGSIKAPEKSFRNCFVASVTERGADSQIAHQWSKPLFENTQMLSLKKNRKLMKEDLSSIKAAKRALGWDYLCQESFVSGKVMT